MAETRKCPECGSELPPAAPQGLCPQCLLKAGLSSESDVDRDDRASSTDDTAYSPPPGAADTGSETMPSPSPGIGPQNSVPSPDQPPGTRIRYVGDYELLEEIARGGMGVVYKARQVSLNRVVAVKMILAGQLATDEEVQRFRREAEAAANLKHTNIVAIHEVGQHDGQYYFSMDYVDGKNLAQLIKENSLHMTELIQILEKVADAIHWAHQRGTLHRDLKPANVLVDKDGEPHITDFGLAKRIDKKGDLTQIGTAMGTLAYMPPEQALGRWDIFGPTSEVYSLGAILYEMLTGRPPFVGGTSFETLRQLQESQPVSPRRRNPRVPPELDTICLKCLEKQLHGRYPTAHALAEELGRFLRQEPIHARPPSLPRKAWSWLQHHPWAITQVAAVLLLGLFWAAYGLWFENRLLVLEKSDPDRMRAMEFGVDLRHDLGRFTVVALFASWSIFELFRARQRKRILHGRRPNSYVLLAFGVLGLSIMLLSIYWGAMQIEVHLWHQWAYPMETEKWEGIEQLQKQHGLKLSLLRKPHFPQWWELGVLALPVVLVWSGVRIAGNALREYNFVMFTSVAADQAARDQAELEESVARKKPKTSVGFLLAIGIWFAMFIGFYFFSGDWTEGPEEWVAFIASSTIGLIIGIAMAAWKTADRKMYWLISGSVLVASGVGVGYFSYLYSTAVPLVGWVAGGFGGKIVGLGVVYDKKRHRRSG